MLESLPLQQVVFFFCQKRGLSLFVARLKYGISATVYIIQIDLIAFIKHIYVTTFMAHLMVISPNLAKHCTDKHQVHTQTRLCFDGTFELPIYNDYAELTTPQGGIVCY
jgi:hypothetical protein